MDARKQVTHIDGKEIISREPALGRSPNIALREDVAITGVEHVLLEDGVETNICSECGWHNVNVGSVTAHLSHHAERRPQYADDAIRMVLREVLRAKAGKHKNFCEEAARVLNEKGIRTAQGQPWGASNVSSLWRKHHRRLDRDGADAQRYQRRRRGQIGHGSGGEECRSGH